MEKPSLYNVLINNEQRPMPTTLEEANQLLEEEFLNQVKTPATLHLLACRSRQYAHHLWMLDPWSTEPPNNLDDIFVHKLKTSGLPENTDKDREEDTIDKDEGFHHCLACPVEVRDLYAVATNLLNELDRPGAQLTCHGWRKVEDLRQSVVRMKKIVDQHFKDINKK